MTNTIGDDAIKITFIQTLPGEEFNVALSLEEACESVELTKYAIFKGFGTYDIIFIHASKDFDPELTKFGPISFILKTTKFFCFNYLEGDSISLFDNLKKHSCVAISIIKINNDKEFNCYTSENTIIDKMMPAPDASTFFLGTLGWSELVAITIGDDLSENIKSCLIPCYSEISKYL